MCILSEFRPQTLQRSQNTPFSIVSGRGSVKVGVALKNSRPLFTLRYPLSKILDAPLGGAWCLIARDSRMRVLTIAETVLLVKRALLHDTLLQVLPDTIYTFTYFVQ